MAINYFCDFSVGAKLFAEPTSTSAPTNTTYKFEVTGGSNFLGAWGGFDSTYSTVIEGIKLLADSLSEHMLTRITPRLEVYPYENPVDTVDNTYTTGFVGSSFSIGSENTIGDSSSTNLGIIGFNNKLSGDKMLIVGQGNEVQGSNVSSLLVGTTNALVSPGAIINSTVVGQNHSISKSLIRSIFSGINNTLDANATNVLVAGSGLKISGNNSSIFGANNQIISASNVLVGGFSNEIENTSSSSNINYYGTTVFGWNNSVKNRQSEGATSNHTNSSLVVGRDNQVAPNSLGSIESMIVGGYNNYIWAGADRGLVVGANNYVIGSGSFTSEPGSSPSASIFESSIVAGNTNYINTTDSIVVGRNNGDVSNSGGAITYTPLQGKELLIIGNNHTSNDPNTKGCFAIGNNITIANSSTATGFIGANMTGGCNNNLYVGSSHSGSTSNSISVGQNNDFEPTGFGSNPSQLSLIAGRNNESKGILNFTLGSSGTINGDTIGNNFIIGNLCSIGDANTQLQKNISIGFNNVSQLNSKILIGKNLNQNIGYNSVGEIVVLGKNNDYANSHYDKTGLAPALIVGASNASGSTTRRDALIITNRTSSTKESCVILPTVGKNHNYPNDASAAIGGVPLYGVYHNDGDLKIRLTSDTGFTSYSSSIRYTTQTLACAGTANQTYYHSGTSAYPVTGDTCMSRSGSTGNYTFTKLTGGWYLLGNAGLIQINSVGVMIASASCPNQLIDFLATGPTNFNSICSFGTSLPVPTTTYYHDGGGTFPTDGDKMYTDSSGNSPASAGYYYLYDAGCDNVYVRITASDGTILEQTECTVC